MTDCLLFRVKEYFPDPRGFFTEVYAKERLNEVGFPDVVQMNVSRSEKDVVRGMHFNTVNPQAKVIRVLQGTIQDVVIDLRFDSPDYGKVQTFTLNSPEHCLLVPEGFAHGFWSLADDTILMYGCSALYDPTNDSGISLHDPNFNFPWTPIFDPNKLNMTDKDLNWPTFELEKKLFTKKDDERFLCKTESS